MLTARHNGPRVSDELNAMLARTRKRRCDPAVRSRGVPYCVVEWEERVHRGRIRGERKRVKSGVIKALL